MSVLKLITHDDELSAENVQELLRERRRLESAIKNRIDPLLKKAWKRYGSFEGSGYYIRKQQTQGERYSESLLARAIVDHLIDPNFRLEQKKKLEAMEVSGDLREDLVNVIAMVLGSFTDSQISYCMNERDGRECLYHHKEALESKLEVLDGKGHGMIPYSGDVSIVIAKNPPKDHKIFEPS